MTTTKDISIRGFWLPLFSFLVVSASSCDTATGTTSNSLVKVINESPGEDCSFGGKLILEGSDRNGDRALGDDEVLNQTFVCSEGSEPSDLLTRIEPEPPGSLCPLGGFVVKTGLDTNDNGVLDDDEIANLEFACNEPPPTCSLIRGSISIHTTEDARALRGCTAIAGDLTIAGAQIRDLDGLEDIEQIDGDLIIVDNQDLENIEALRSLRTVGGQFVTISNNAKLININGLRSLGSIGGGFQIERNASLTSTGSFLSLIEIPGQLVIGENPLLTSVGDFSRVTQMGAILIQHNDSLVSLAGFSNLARVDVFGMTGNDLIQSLSGFASLEASGQMTITDHEALTSIGLSRLVFATDIFIDGCPALVALDLPRLEIIPGTLRISQNASIPSLDGLPLLQSTGSLIVEDNSGLLTLEGLDSFRTVRNQLFVRFNSLLPACEAERLAVRVGMPCGCFGNLGTSPCE